MLVTPSFLERFDSAAMRLVGFLLLPFLYVVIALIVGVALAALTTVAN